MPVRHTNNTTLVTLTIFLGVERFVTLQPGGLPNEAGAPYIDHLNQLSYVSVASAATTVEKTPMDLTSLLQVTSDAGSV